MHPAVLAYLTDDVPRQLSWERPKNPGQEATQKVEKGHCRHCGKHVGRGVAFHEKACPKRPDEAA